MSQKLNCLVIEDSLFDQKMIKRVIASARFDANLEFASTLDAARQALAVDKYSVILCDNTLPDGNGTEFAQALSQESKYRHADIIIISGWPSPFMWAKARAAGLQIIDKNDQPQARLLEIFKRKLGLKNDSDSANKTRYAQ